METEEGLATREEEDEDEEDEIKCLEIGVAVLKLGVDTVRVAIALCDVDAGINVTEEDDEEESVDIEYGTVEFSGIDGKVVEVAGLAGKGAHDWNKAGVDRVRVAVGFGRELDWSFVEWRKLDTKRDTE